MTSIADRNEFWKMLKTTSVMETVGIRYSRMDIESNTKVFIHPQDEYEHDFVHALIDLMMIPYTEDKWSEIVIEYDCCG